MASREGLSMADKKQTYSAGASDRLAATCDVIHYGSDKTNPNARCSAPNKLYEAIAAGKPLLCGDFGELSEIVRNQQCGILCDTSTPEGVAARLSKLLSREELVAMGRRAGALQDTMSRSAADRYLLDAYARLASVEDAVA